MLPHKLKVTLTMIRFEHTVFALPFALIGALLAEDGLPAMGRLGWIVAAMVGARSAAMTFNRIADLDYDRDNPRTRNRPLPAGILTFRFAVLFMMAMAGLFIFSAWRLNPLCFYLSFPTLAILFLYSYTKRFTSLSHLALGFAIGLSPLAAWLAVRGDFAWTPVLLSGAVMLWITGFDIIYACQDIEFDRQVNLFSIPARLGAQAALKISTLLHVGTVGLLLLTARLTELGWIAYSGIAVVAAVLVWEHQIVRPNDLSRIDVAFFNMNGYVSILLLVTFSADILIR